VWARQTNESQLFTNSLWHSAKYLLRGQGYQARDISDQENVERSDMQDCCDIGDWIHRIYWEQK
jgi:hypothetical protein